MLDLNSVNDNKYAIILSIFFERKFCVWIDFSSKMTLAIVIKYYHAIAII